MPPRVENLQRYIREDLHARVEVAAPAAAASVASEGQGPTTMAGASTQEAASSSSDGMAVEELTSTFGDFSLSQALEHQMDLELVGPRVTDLE